MALDNFLNLAQRYPDVLSPSIIFKITSFLHYAPRFKSDIILAQALNWPAAKAPFFLPQSVAILLSHLCETNEESVNILWEHLKELVWDYEEKAKVVEERFNSCGRDLSIISLYPPISYCSTAHCNREERGLKLQKTDYTQGILYTLDKGACPVWVIRLQCEGCQTAYYHNYSVKNSMRSYYEGDLPAIIQVGEHQFVEQKVIDMWRIDMHVAWKSFTNCARTYELALTGTDSIPKGWSFKAALKGDHVQDGFTILALLKDHYEHNSILEVPHTGEQVHQFTEAIRARNARIKLYGQQGSITHRCLKCTRIYKDQDGNVSSRHMDGVTLGHPCCGFHNCKIPLTTSRDRYCVDHRHLSEICCIKDCNKTILPGKRTCVDQPHQEIEHIYVLRGESRIQLQEKKRTHNEQILVAPCGMILARETFYGAEAISTCAEFIKRTFRIDSQKPNHIFFDNNCMLAKHTRGDPFFEGIGLTVDVFHFNCKHSVKDTFCQSNCNPAIYPELLGTNNKGWYFNSSIAEQTNVWLGGFHSILREMGVERYNFFLDQMILQRNKLTHKKLLKDGDIISM
ncbi:hypothetical protein BJ912DRAFT_1026825 [Pholiota molesta]|nr:hypothetical protein BJ912DRAFT_1026825 [Pholiota molesta]